MNPDVVYLCRKGENEELRYSLRSLVNIPHGRVWLVGGAPSWYTGDLIRVAQHGMKNQITGRALIAACLDPRISDPFLMFNDDFYVMRPGPIPPPRHRGTIQGVIDWYERQGITSSGYVTRMRSTMKTLKTHGIRRPLSYELHVPLLVHKLQMLGATRFGGQQRTMYGNLVRLGGTKMNDVKVINGVDPIPDGRWLSTMDDTFARLEPLLRGRFPNASRWEL